MCSPRHQCAPHPLQGSLTANLSSSTYREVKTAFCDSNNSEEKITKEDKHIKEYTGTVSIKEAVSYGIEDMTSLSFPYLALSFESESARLFLAFSICSTKGGSGGCAMLVFFLFFRFVPSRWHIIII